MNIPQQLLDLLGRDDIKWTTGPLPPEVENVKHESYSGTTPRGETLLVVYWELAGQGWGYDGTAMFQNGEFNVIRLPKPIAKQLVEQAREALTK